MELKNSHILKHETKRQTLLRFGLVVLVVITYFMLVSIKYGVKEGFMVTLTTWSFFVLCTPIADAGFLIDFPIRMITKLRMIFSEIGVWIIAISLNIYNIIFSPAIYEQTGLLKIFHHILGHPIPFWFIIILSAGGTFFSIYFADELLDVAKHKQREKHNKHRRKHLIIIAGFGALALILAYIYLISQLKIDIPVF